MEVRILGAHQCEAAGQRFTSFLVDGVMAIDAGGLASALTLDEQCNVADVLVTHSHFDHIKDLGSFGFNLIGRRVARIHGAAEVRYALENYLLNSSYWLNFFNGPDTSAPTFEFVTIVPGASFTIGSHTIQTVPINHTIPSMGYHVTGENQRSLYYTSDNGPGCGHHWGTVHPDVLVTEVTYSNELSDSARAFGHLSPELLHAEIETFRAMQGYVPRIVIVHVNPYHEKAIRAEVAKVARAIGAPIEVAREDMRLTV